MFSWLFGTEIRLCRITGTLETPLRGVFTPIPPVQGLRAIGGGLRELAAVKRGAVRAHGCSADTSGEVVVAAAGGNGGGSEVGPQLPVARPLDAARGTRCVR